MTSRDARQRTLLTGAEIAQPGRLLAGRTLVLEGDRIVDMVEGSPSPGANEQRVDCSHCFIVPGFVDVHVHGLAGIDVLDGPGALAKVAAALPRWGVTSFCPTTIACGPEALSTFLSDVAAARASRPADSARVLPAHLESNFINPGYRGAQPLEHLRVYQGPQGSQDRWGAAYSAGEILAELDRRRSDVGIVTLAPEIGEGLELVQRLVAQGIRVSLGHSGATFEQARDAISAGARHATHIFNRMSPMTHRDPGLVGAVLAFDDIAVELICDGHHVHPAVMQVAIAAKGVSRVMAITDGTAGSGLPAGSCVRLGGQEITTGDVARLADGTIAGSVLTMDRAFQTLVGACAGPIDQVAELCSTTPARELGLHGFGVIEAGAIADLVVLDSSLAVQSTWIAGERVWVARS